MKWYTVLIKYWRRIWLFSNKSWLLHTFYYEPCMLVLIWNDLAVHCSPSKVNAMSQLWHNCLPAFKDWLHFEMVDWKVIRNYWQQQKIIVGILSRHKLDHNLDNLLHWPSSSSLIYSVFCLNRFGTQIKIILVKYPKIKWFSNPL